MKIRVIGGGWFGCTTALELIRAGHEVELHERSDRLFSGASGGNPCRLHQGQHYPRSKKTREACLRHHAEFMERFGHLTRHVPVNIYAIAEADSLVDFETYRQILRDEIEFITVLDPAEFGLQRVEGAILTGERHIIADEARVYFESALNGAVHLKSPVEVADDDRWDWTVDCSFCALDGQGIDRYEPCLTVLLEGPTDRAVTIMDGPFPSIYPWNEDRGLCSLTSALYTPFSKTCRTYGEARAVLDGKDAFSIQLQASTMLTQMSIFWPEVMDIFRVADTKLTIRAMHRSAADARLVDVIRVGDRAVRVRAGKVDAVLEAARRVQEMIV